jgi:polysaccharide pyruvyl transferase WcaK-like protein
VNVGAIGWWHHDNRGDLAMLASLRHSLAPHRVIPLDTDLEANDDTIARLNRLDFLLLGGGTLIRGRPLPLFGGFRRWGKRLRVPLGGLGLGVSHVEPGSAADVQALIEQSRFFFVRDETSRQMLRHPAVQVAPDLTFACPLPSMGQPLGDRAASPLGGANLRATNTVNGAAWVAALRRLPCRWRGLPLSSFASWQERQLMQELDPACPAAFSPALYQGLDLVVGTALHAIIFAVQAGIPVIAIDYASKVSRFMTEVGLGEYVLAADAVAELPQMYQRLLDDHEAIRATVGRQRDRLAHESQVMFGAVRQAIAAVGEAPARPAAKVSVIVVAGGSPEALDQSLASCREQTYPDVEPIVAPALAGSLAERLNLALTRATGEYVTWLEAGDCFSPDAIDTLVSHLDRSQAHAAYAGYYVVESGKIASQAVAHPTYKLARHNVVTPCFLYRRQLHDAMGGYDANSAMPAYDFWLRLATHYRLCPIHTPLLLANKRSARAPAGLEHAVRAGHFGRQPLFRRLLWKCLDNRLADGLLLGARGAWQRIGG